MVAKAHPPSSSESDDWGDEGWIVDCPCGINYDDGEKMVECDECGVWVHTACCRVVKDQETFNCDKCKSKKRKEDEESEVAQLLVDLPSKTLSFEERGHDRAAVAHSDPLCTPLAADNGDRAHVHGVPGGDPRLFFAGSIFSQQLWKYAGYVRKPLRIDFDDLPVDSGDHDIFQLLDDPLTDELALVVTLDSARLEHSRGEAKPSIDDPARETHSGELAASKDKIVKTEIKRVERSGKHKLKLKLKHRHKPHKEGKPRHHEKRTRDDAGGLQDQVHKKKPKSNGGDAAKAGDERFKKAEGLFRHANVSPTNLEGSVQEVQTPVKKVEGSPQAAKSKREGFSSDAILSFKSPQSSPKNPKTMKKLAVQEFMDGGITICGKCCREEPILGCPLTFSGSKFETKVCRECGRDSEKMKKSNPCEYSDPVHCPSQDVKSLEETANLLHLPVGDEPGPEGKLVTGAGIVLASDIGDRKIDGESLRTDISQRPSLSDMDDNHNNSSRGHGGLRSSEKSEPRVVNHAPGAVEQPVSAIDVKAGVLLEAKSVGFRETGGKVVHFDKEQKTSHQDVSEFHRPVTPAEATKGQVAGSPSGRPKDKEALTAGGSKGQGFKAGTCSDNLVHPQSKPSASIAPIKVEISMENCELGMKSDDKLARQHSEAAGSGENAGSSTASRPLTGGMAGDAARGDRQMPIDPVSGHDASLGPGHQSHSIIVSSSEMLLQQKTSEGTVDVTSDKTSSKASPTLSNADGRDGRTFTQLAGGIRDKVAGRPGINRSNTAVSHQDIAQVCQVSLEAAHKATEPVVTEQILQSLSPGPNEESLPGGKQHTSDLHHQSGSSKHVHKKHQDLHGSTSLQRIEMEHTTVLRQQVGALDQAEAAESLASPSYQRQAEQSPGVDVVNHKTSPLQSPLCQQARQHHLHSSRGRAGASSSPALGSGGNSRNCSPAAGGVSKSTTPGGSKSSGGSSSGSPKSPPVPPQSSKHVGGRSPPPQRPSSVVKTPHGSSKQSSAPASNSKHHPSPAKPCLVSSSTLPLKTGSLKQPPRTTSLPSLKGVDNTLPPKSPGASVPASVRGSGLGLSNAGPSGKSSSLSKAVSAGKPGGQTTRHVVSSKVSNSQAVAKQASAQLSVRPHSSLASEPHKFGPQPGKHPLATVAKQGSAGTTPREDKSPVPSASGLKGMSMSTMPPPPPPGSLKRSPPAGPAVTLKDEEVAMLLHQELNSSPRVPRVPRARLTNSGMQGVSTNQPLVGPAKRLLSGAIQSTIQSVNRDMAPRKRLRDDRHREVGRTSSAGDETSKAGGTIRKHEDGSRADDGHHHPIAAGHVEIGNIKEKSSHLDSARRPSHGFPRSSLSIVVPARSDDSSDQGDKKSPADGTILTLPGLIDDILSNSGQQLEYEDVCEAVLPYWQKLRKPNGDRYAYASHRQAVLDCLRNRSSWSHLVDRGPKTNLGRKRRRTDIALSTESDEDEDTDGPEHVRTDDSELVKNVRRGREPENEKLNPEHVERSRVINVALPEDVPKGKRKARSRRRRPLATEDGKAQSNGNSIRTKTGASELKSASDKVIGPGQEEEPDAPSSPSSEDAVSNYSEEDEEMVVHKGMRSSRRRRDGESSEGEDEMD